ncbi:DUF2147 domain-containing protein [Arenibacter sp. GZD96]|uniref:DUF2147 domain-containing protein n=1 Tax=Aurantibrevibacter litoralis TaxID=3106030 RepID=UPI002AFEE0A9|nr:DUF2147 domain-containing protein [Arenibacter sp. GZD-96]MEA1786885.1 DUF2147 domain-containing protein [Arenibacter sp. GZD-96]
MTIRQRSYASFIFLFFFVLIAKAQSILGQWKTVDDRHNLEKAVIEVYKENGNYHGKVIKILEKGKTEATCEKCSDERKGQPILGMKIIENLQENGKGQYKGNTLFDPEQAMTFKCKIWLNPDNPNELKVRGYLALFYRTQTWIRVGG